MARSSVTPTPAKPRKLRANPPSVSSLLRLAGLAVDAWSELDSLLDGAIAPHQP